jgi:hypothetical protein
MQTRSLLLALALAAPACSASPGPGSSLVSVALPVTLAQAEYAHVLVTQGTAVQDLVVPADGIVTATVQVGVPADIEVTVLNVDRSLDLPDYQAFTGATSTIPVAGQSQPIVIDLVQTGSLAGTVWPGFSITGSFHPILDGRLVTVEDLTTTHVFTVQVPSGLQFTVPQGRPMRFSVPSATDPGGVAEKDLDATFATQTGLEVVLTTPAATTRAARTNTTTTPLDLTSVLGTLPFPAECTMSSGCPIDTVYSSSVQLVAGLEGNQTVWCRYSSAPTVCSYVNVAVDLTAPTLTALAEPPVVPAAGGNIELTVTADEALDQTSASATYTPATGGNPVELCASPQWLSSNLVRCTFDSALLTGRPADVAFTATDLAGNEATVTTRLRSDPGSSFVLTRALMYPPYVPYHGSNLYVGIEVAGRTDCASQLTTVSLQQIDFTPPGGTATPLTIDVFNVGFRPVSLHLDGTVGNDRATLWAPQTGTNYFLQEGTYTFIVALTSDCGSDSASLDVPVGGGVLKWLTTDPTLVFGRWGDATTSPVLPLIYSQFYPSMASSDTNVLDASQGDGIYVIATHNPGNAVVTAADANSGATSAVQVSVQDAPPVAVLQLDDAAAGVAAHVQIFGTYGQTPISLDAGLGAPIRLLWLPNDGTGQGALYVLGAKGLMDVSHGRLVTPAFTGNNLVDATVRPTTTGYELIVLDDTGELYRVDLATAAISAQGAPDLTPYSCGTQLLHLASTAATGDLLGATTSCVVSFRDVAAAAPVTSVVSLVQPVVTTSPALFADPSSDFVLVQTSGGFEEVESGLGGADFGAIAPSGATTDAATIDLTTGNPIASAGGSVDFYAKTAGYYSNGQLDAPGVGLQRIVYDANAQVIYEFTSETPPRVLVRSTYSRLDMSTRVQLPSLSNGVIADAILLGPQIISVSPPSVQPGSVMTIRGVNLAGGTVDIPYVLGIRAAQLSDSPTTVVALVPPILARLTEGSQSLTVGVSSGGPMTQVNAVPVALFADPRPYAIDPPIIAPSCGSGNCPPGPATVLSAAAGTYVQYPAGVYSAATDNSLTQEVPFPVVEAAFSGDGLRLLSYSESFTTQWNRVLYDYRQSPYELRSVPLDELNAYTTVGHLAADPTNRFLATRADNQVVLLSAATRAVASAGLGVPTSDGTYAFSADGTTLVGASVNVDGSPWFVALDVTGALSPSVKPVEIPKSIDAACPATMSYVHILGPAGPDPLAVWGVAGSGGALYVLEVRPLSVGVNPVYELACFPTGLAVDPALPFPAALAPSGRYLAVGLASGSIALLAPDDPGRITAQLDPAAVGATPSSLSFGSEQAYTATTVWYGTAQSTISSVSVR